MRVNISKYNKQIINEFYDNSCFYSSFVFLSNIIIAYYFKYYVFSFLFVLLLITSLIFYTYTNIYTNILDKIPIALLFLYGLNLLYNKCKYITLSIKKNETNSHFSNGLVADKNNFDDDNRPKILSGRCNNNLKICLSTLIVFSFLVTNYLFYYGYITKKYCYHEDKKIADLWHSLLHINSSVGFNLLILL
jgi:hypothetical protein